MNELFKLAAMALVQAQAGPQGKGANGHVLGMAITAAGFALAAMIVIGCVLAALWTYVLPFVGAAGAYLVVALATAVMWIGLYLVMRRSDMASGGSQGTVEAFDAIREIAERFVAQNPGAGLMTALVAGLMAGTRDVPRR